MTFSGIYGWIMFTNACIIWVRAIFNLPIHMIDFTGASFVTYAICYECLLKVVRCYVVLVFVRIVLWVSSTCESQVNDDVQVEWTESTNCDDGVILCTQLWFDVLLNFTGNIFIKFLCLALFQSLTISQYLWKLFWLYTD